MSSVIDQLPSARLREQDLGLLGALAYQAYAEGLARHLAASGYADIRPADTQLFRLLAARGGTTISEIARIRGVSKQAASQHVAQFAERGYGVLSSSDEDGRERIVTLTKRARDARAAGIAYAKQIEARLERELGADAVAAARAAFARVIELNLDDASELVRLGVAL
jgi:DNA-binding MarR family transcriptional regulator